jgi:ubiquinone/menaquinone biosynthesis C-methylase UbiE
MRTSGAANEIPAEASASNEIGLIADAFSRTAEKYDRFAEDHPNLTRMRRVVADHLLNLLQPGDRILELNAGSGTDAVALAQRGFRVHATDIAPGMLARLRDKVAEMQLSDRVSVQHCSYTALEDVSGGPFDAIFSNLGGLNCIPDLRLVTQKLATVLRPGGLVTWVLMPPVCLWEWAIALRGDFRYAFRRLSLRGTIAHLEGRYFKVWYFSPRRAMRAFGPEFRPLAIQGVSVFAPPAESKSLAQRHPRLYAWLCSIDDRLAHRAPFHGWGDFYILSMRHVG